MLAACIVCGSRDFRAPYRRRLPWLVSCQQCGLACARDPPSEVELAQIYGEQYFDKFGLKAHESAYRKSKQATFDQLLKQVEAHCAPGRLLDIGSALGDLIVVAQQRGWDAMGIERNRSARDQAELVVPGATRLGTIEQLDEGALAGKRASYDAVTCTEVIEHLVRPDRFLQVANRLLRPGGVLAVTTPDHRSLLSFLQGPQWVHYHREHLWYFSRRNLCLLARKCGFETLACASAWKQLSLRYVFSIFQSNRGNATLAAVGRWGLRVPCLLDTPLPRLPVGILLLARKVGD